MEAGWGRKERGRERREGIEIEMWLLEQALCGWEYGTHTHTTTEKVKGQGSRFMVLPLMSACLHCVWPPAPPGGFVRLPEALHNSPGPSPRGRHGDASPDAEE